MKMSRQTYGRMVAAAMWVALVVIVGLMVASAFTPLIVGLAAGKYLAQ